MAAGLGFKEFTTGDVLTAADANGYLASQVVMVFASAAARTSAIASPQEGMISYLKDTNVTQYYSGSAWVSIGGGASPLTTKGDLYTFSTTDARLGVGSNNTVLTADSAEATGLKWAAPSAPSFVGASVYKSASQSISNATNTLLTFNSENFDTNTYHDTSTNTGRITVPSGKAGYYNLQAIVAFAAGAVGLRQIVFFKNGSVLNYGVQSAATTASENISNASYVVSLAVSDYVEAYVYQTSGGAINVLGGADFTTFSATYLGA